MYKIPEGTLFTGKSLIYVPECHSTNDIAAQMLQQPSIHEGSVIITDRQLSGRGQRGAKWVSEHGKNLTLSIVLKPSFLEPKEQFFLNVVISLAVCEALKSYLSTVLVKWPNDIMVNDKKIGGILIENQIKGNVLANSIVGIGLNVNQTVFPLATATSLRLITGKDVILQQVLESLLKQIEVHYIRLKKRQTASLMKDYLGALYWRGAIHTFSDKQGEFTGLITGVDASGRLHIDINGLDRYFAVKEVEYIR